MAVVVVANLHIFAGVVDGYMANPAQVVEHGVWLALVDVLLLVPAPVLAVVDDHGLRVIKSAKYNDTFPGGSTAAGARRIHRGCRRMATEQAGSTWSFACLHSALAGRVPNAQNRPQEAPSECTWPRVDMGSRQRIAPHEPVAPRTRLLAVGCGDTRTGALEVAGYDVSRRTYVEFAQLAETDLLILALMPPEPPTAVLVRVLRERSDVRVLAVVQGLGASERTAIIEAGAEACLDAAADDEQFLACARTVLHEHVDRMPADQLG